MRSRDGSTHLGTRVLVLILILHQFLFLFLVPILEPNPMLFRTLVLPSRFRLPADAGRLYLGFSVTRRGGKCTKRSVASSSSMEQELVCDRSAIATALHLSIALDGHCWIEGPRRRRQDPRSRRADRVLDTELIRLQCYEGLDAAAALYEWNYSKQLLHILLQDHSTDALADRRLQSSARRPVPASSAVCCQPFDTRQIAVFVIRRNRSQR